MHVNLNTGTREEILLIPGAGTRMAREFAEYRPWKTWAQFDKEIGKYVPQTEVDRLKQYVFIPVNLNTATDEDILSIPGAGTRMVREFKEYRPVEDEGAVREGDWQVRRRQGSRPPLALRGDLSSSRCHARRCSGPGCRFAASGMLRRMLERLFHLSAARAPPFAPRSSPASRRS